MPTGEHMAIFETEKKEAKAYIALLNKTGEELIAFISPVKGVANEHLVELLKAKNLNVELREPKGDIIDIEL